MSELLFGNYLRQFIEILFSVLKIAIFGRALLSWFPIGPGNPFYQLHVILFQITEPILSPIRRILPSFGMMDFSPLVALLVLQLVHAGLMMSLKGVGL
jgi:YggT family protein